MHKVEYPQAILDRVRIRRGGMRSFHQLDPTKTALLVIDMQNAFLLPGMPLEMPVAREIVSNINELAGALREAGGKIVWFKQTHAPIENRWTVYLDEILSREQSQKEKSSLTRGTVGHELYNELDVRPEDVVMEKIRFSAFVPGSSTIDEYLKEQGIDTLIITGTVTNSCCEATARDAMMMNYRVVFISDANAAHTDGEHNATLSNIVRIFGDVCDTREAIGMIRR